MTHFVIMSAFLMMIYTYALFYVFEYFKAHLGTLYNYPVMDV